MKNIVAILALAVGLVSSHCFAQEVTPWSYNRSVVSCTPRKLSSSGTLKLKLAPGHGKELAILRAKDNAWFFIVVGSPPTDMPILMSPEQFSRTKHLELSASILWPRWMSTPTKERVFSSPGRYDIFVSENLESEIGGFKCTIHYANMGPNNSFKRTGLRPAA